MRDRDMYSGTRASHIHRLILPFVLSAPLFIMGVWVMFGHVLDHPTGDSMGLGVGALVFGSLIVVVGALVLASRR